MVYYQLLSFKSILSTNSIFIVYIISMCVCFMYIFGICVGVYALCFVANKLMYWYATFIPIAAAAIRTVDRLLWTQGHNTTNTLTHVRPNGFHKFYHFIERKKNIFFLLSLSCTICLCFLNFDRIFVIYVVKHSTFQLTLYEAIYLFTVLEGFSPIYAVSLCFINYFGLLCFILHSVGWKVIPHHVCVLVRRCAIGGCVNAYKTIRVIMSNAIKFWFSMNHCMQMYASVRI